MNWKRLRVEARMAAEGVSVIRSEIGWRGLARLLPRYLALNSRWDPFASLDGGALSDAERFTRSQLRPVLLIDRVLRENFGLPEEEIFEVLRGIVSQGGARFIAQMLSVPRRSAWMEMDEARRRGFADTILGFFRNAEVHNVEFGDEWLGFDVTRCQFVELSHRLKRAELAPLFCEADSVYFDRPGAPLRLDRETTLASGGPRCAFRFRFPKEKRGDVGLEV